MAYGRFAEHWAQMSEFIDEKYLSSTPWPFFCARSVIFRVTAQEKRDAERNDRDRILQCKSPLLLGCYDLSSPTVSRKTTL